MAIKFFPQLGRNFSGAFAELSDPDSSELPKVYFERNPFLSATISIKELWVSSQYSIPSQRREGKTQKYGEASSRRTRRIAGYGKIVESNNSYVHYVTSFSPLGSDTEFTAVSVSIIEGGTNAGEVKFSCYDYETSFPQETIQGVDLDIKVPSTEFDQILSEIESERFLMVLEIDLSECAGCVSARNSMPGGPVELKFLSSHMDVHNHAEFPVDFFGTRELGSGAQLQILFDSSTKKATKLRSRKKARIAEPVELKLREIGVDLNSLKVLLSPLEGVRELREISQTIKDIGFFILLLGTSTTALILIAVVTDLVRTFFW